MQHNAVQHNSVTRRFQRNTLEEQMQHSITQQCYMEILLEINPTATQHNTTVQQEDIIDYPRGTAAMQCNTTVLQRNSTRNKPKCNMIQCNRIGNEKISETYLGGTRATQHNATVLEGNFTRNKLKCNAMQHNNAKGTFQRNT